MKIEITSPVFLKGDPLETGAVVDVDDRIADLFIGMGKATLAQDDDGQAPDFDNMTVAALKDIAREHDIALGAATRKADIWAIIQDALGEEEE